MIRSLPRFAWFWLAFAVGQLAAARAYDRYVPLALIPAAILALALLVFWLTGERWRRLAATPWPAALFMVAAIAVVAVMYPIADGLKFHGGGSDQDDAIIVGAQALLRGVYPYGERTYLGNPLSPAPGWLLLHLPFVAAHLYPFASVAMLLAVAAALVRRTGNWRSATLFLALWASSPFAWELMVTGSDLPAIGTAAALVLLLADAPSAIERNAAKVLAALTVSSRLIMVYVAGLFGLALWGGGRRQAVAVGLAAGLGGLALDVAFYLWAPAEFSPLHLIGKGSALLAGPWKLAAVGATAAILLLVLRARPASLGQRMGWAALGMLVPFGALALASLARWAHWNFADWEGANYVMPALPLLAAAAALDLVEKAP